MDKKAIFLDRDGTINKDVDFLSEIKDIQIFDGVIDSLFEFKSLGFLNIIISNQSGVARGFFSLERLEEINNYFKKILCKNGIQLIDEIYFAPYLKDGVIQEFAIDSEDRKPGIGLIKKAAGKYDINLNDSFFVGDSYVDMLCASNAGIKKIYVNTGKDKSELIKCKKENIFIDYVCKDLKEACGFIKSAVNP